MTRFKVCCIQSVDEARLAIAHGASALGLVSAMPSGPGVISEDQIRAIAIATPPPIATFLLTSLTDATLVIEQVRYCATGVVQLCDRTTEEARARIRKYAPHVRIVQVVHVTGPESVKEAKAAARQSDALLLDSGSYAAPVKELGGTGRAHDWSLSKKIVAASPIPVFLAGGLHSGNAAEACRVVRPYALDVCGGLRTGGRLDAAKLAAFRQAVPS
jgi:phosphoribosylanthranilate isomerase